MKKLLVVLLAFACVFAVSAQVTVSVATSGKVNIVNASANNATNPQAGIAMDGDDSDKVTLTLAGKDSAFGGKVYFKNFNASVLSAATLSGTTLTTTAIQTLALSNWNAWYKYDFGKVELGTAGSGFCSNNVTDIVSKWDVSGQGAGIYYSTPALSGFTAQVFYAAPTTAQDAWDSIRTSGASVQYVVENTLKVQALATAGLVKNTTIANFFVDFTGVPNLDVYTNGQWDQTNANSFIDFGASYVAGGLKVIGEFEGNFGGSTFLYDAALRANYKLNDSISCRLQGKYLANTAALVTTPQIVGQGYVYYTVGNGLSANLMLGYDTVNNFIYQLYAGYSLSL